MIYLNLIGLWIAYFAIHSILASTPVKKQFNGRYYRVLYNIIAIIGLLGIFIFSALQEAVVFWEKNSLSQAGGLILATYGIIIMKRVFKHYSLKQFMGIQADDAPPKLVQAGALQYVRHPIYTASILIVLGFFLFSPTDLNLVSMTCIFLYLPIGIVLEEKKLIDTFGEQYRKYQQEVPMLFPKNMKWMNLLK